MDLIGKRKSMRTVDEEMMRQERRLLDFPSSVV